MQLEPAVSNLQIRYNWVGVPPGELNAVSALQLGGFTPDIFEKHDFEIVVHPVGQLLVGSGGPRPLGARMVATPIFLPKVA